MIVTLWETYFAAFGLKDRAASMKSAIWSLVFSSFETS